MWLLNYSINMLRTHFEECVACGLLFPVKHPSKVINSGYAAEIVDYSFYELDWYIYRLKYSSRRHLQI